MYLELVVEGVCMVEMPKIPELGPKGDGRFSMMLRQQLLIRVHASFERLPHPFSLRFVGLAHMLRRA